MTVLLTPDHIVVERPAGSDDGHGWAEAGTPAPVWSGFGSWQTERPEPVTGAGEGGDGGLYSPLPRSTVTGHLPADCGVEPGDIATVGGKRWHIFGVQPVVFPGLDELLVYATEAR